MSDDFETRLLTPDEYPLWDALVDEVPSGTPFHATWWISTLAGYVGARLEIIGCFRKGVMWGGCALFGRRSGPFQRAIFPPTALYNGMVVRPRDTDSYPTQVIHVIAVTDSMGKWIEQRYDEAHLTHHYTLFDVRGLIWRRWRSRLRYTYVFHVGSMEEMLRRAERSREAMFRKAEAAGLHCEPSDAIEEFLPLYAKTFARHGMRSPVPLPAIAAIYRAGRARDAIQLFLTRTPNGEVVSGTIALWTRCNALLWLAASEPAWLDQGASVFTYFHTFAHLAQRFPEVDFASANVRSLHHHAALMGAETRLVPRTELTRSPALRLLHALRHMSHSQPEEG
ncbi:MAG: GNAT family N-acetyltransferase [Anaerolineae bacterium]